MKSICNGTANEIYEENHNRALYKLRHEATGGSSKTGYAWNQRRRGQSGKDSIRANQQDRFSNNVGDYTNVGVNICTLYCGCVNINGTSHSNIKNVRLQGVEKNSRMNRKYKSELQKQSIKKSMQSDTSVRDAVFLRPRIDMRGSEDIVHSLFNFYCTATGDGLGIPDDAHVLFSDFASTINYVRMDVIRCICCKYWHPMKKYVNLLSRADVFKYSVYTALVYKINKLTDLCVLYVALPEKIKYELKVYRDAHLPLALYIETYGVYDDVSLTGVVQCHRDNCSMVNSDKCRKVYGRYGLWTITPPIYNGKCKSSVAMEQDIITAETIIPSDDNRCLAYLECISTGGMCMGDHSRNRTNGESNESFPFDTKRVNEDGDGSTCVSENLRKQSKLQSANHIAPESRDFEYIHNRISGKNGEVYDVFKLNFAKRSPLDHFLPCPDWYLCEETLPDLGPILIKLGYWEDIQGYSEGGMNDIYGKSFEFLCHIFFKTLPSRCKAREFGTTLEGYVCLKVVFDVIRLISLVSLLGNYRKGVWHDMCIKSRMDAIENFIIDPDVNSLVSVYRKGDRIPLAQLREYMVNTLGDVSCLEKYIARTYNWESYVGQVYSTTNLMRRLFMLDCNATEINKKLESKTKSLLHAYYRRIEQDVSGTLMKVIQTKFSPKGETILTTVNQSIRSCIRSLVREFNVPWKPLSFTALIMFKFIRKRHLGVIRKFEDAVAQSHAKKELESLLDTMEPEIMVVLWYYCFEYKRMSTTRVYTLDLLTFAQQTESLRVKHNIPPGVPIDTYYCLHPWCKSCNQLKSFVVSNSSKGKCANKNKTRKSWYSYGYEKVRINTMTGKYYCGDKKLSSSGRRKYAESTSVNNFSLSLDHHNNLVTRYTQGVNDSLGVVSDESKSANRFRDDSTRSSVFGRKEKDCKDTELAWIFMPGCRVFHSGRSILLCPRCNNLFEFSVTDKDALGFYCKQCNVKTGDMAKYLTNTYSTIMNMHVKGRRKFDGNEKLRNRIIHDGIGVNDDESSNVEIADGKVDADTSGGMEYSHSGNKSSTSVKMEPDTETVLASSKVISQYIKDSISNVEALYQKYVHKCDVCGANLSHDMAVDVCDDDKCYTSMLILDKSFWGYMHGLVKRYGMSLGITRHTSVNSRSTLMSVIKDMLLMRMGRDDRTYINSCTPMCDKYSTQKELVNAHSDSYYKYMAHDLSRKNRLKHLCSAHIIMELCSEIVNNGSDDKMDVKFKENLVCKRHFADVTEKWLHKNIYDFSMSDMKRMVDMIKPSTDIDQMVAICIHIIEDIIVKKMVYTGKMGYLMATSRDIFGNAKSRSFRVTKCVPESINTKFAQVCKALNVKKAFLSAR